MLHIDYVVSLLLSSSYLVVDKLTHFSKIFSHDLLDVCDLILASERLLFSCWNLHSCGHHFSSAALIGSSASSKT